MFIPIKIYICCVGFIYILFVHNSRCPKFSDSQKINMVEQDFLLTHRNQVLSLCNDQYSGWLANCLRPAYQNLQHCCFLGHHKMINLISVKLSMKVLSFNCLYHFQSLWTYFKVMSVLTENLCYLIEWNSDWLLCWLGDKHTIIFSFQMYSWERIVVFSDLVKTLRLLFLWTLFDWGLSNFAWL